MRRPKIETIPGPRSDPKLRECYRIVDARTAAHIAMAAHHAHNEKFLDAARERRWAGY